MIYGTTEANDLISEAANNKKKKKNHHNTYHIVKQILQIYFFDVS